MEFTKRNFEAFRKDLKVALAEVEKKYDVEVKPANISYSDVNFTLKLEVNKAGVDMEKKNFEENCFYYGFEPEHYLAEFIDRGVTYQLVGFKPKARKNTTIIRDKKTGTQYVCSNDYVKKMTGLKSKPITVNQVDLNGNVINTTQVTI